MTVEPATNKRHSDEDRSVSRPAALEAAWPKGSEVPAIKHHRHSQLQWQHIALGGCGFHFGLKRPCSPPRLCKILKRSITFGERKKR